MERAGAAAVREALASYPNARRWQILCGAGNNAGDGYVVARLAASEGIDVATLSVADPESLTGDAATAYADFTAEGGVAMPWAGEIDPDVELLHAFFQPERQFANSENSSARRPTQEAR